jgi:hypothetical protein
MSAAARATSMLSVYDGRRCVGFILHRGPMGFEAIDDVDRSLGFFSTQDEAASALTWCDWPAADRSQS